MRSLTTDQEPVNRHDSTPVTVKPKAKAIDKCAHATKQLIAEGGHRPFADLSTKISSEFPSLDHWEYGIHINFDSNCLHVIESPYASNGFVTSVQMYDHAASDSQASSPFTFPKGFHPVSAVYSISPPTSSSSSIPFTLKIMHFADPNSPEELEQLCFAMATNHSPTQFEVVQGGSFRVGENFGEIKLQHACRWCIVKQICGLSEHKKPQYVAAVHYTSDSTRYWTMQLIVAKYDCEHALNEFMRRNFGSSIAESDRFLFKFKSKQLKAKISNYKKIQGHNVVCKNGWTITPDECRISQEFADRFKNYWDEPEKCVFNIDTKKMHTACYLENLPLIKLQGIKSNTTEIQVNLPRSASATMMLPWQEDSLIRRFLLSNLPPPTGKEVYDWLKPHSTHWYEIAEELDVYFNDREELLMDNIRTAKMKLENIIYKWIESECSPVTWGNLFQVLKNLRYNYLINTIIRNKMPAHDIDQIHENQRRQQINEHRRQYYRKRRRSLIYVLLLFSIIVLVILVAVLTASKYISWKAS